MTITAAAGDTNLVFVAEPLNQQIAVLDRATGFEVGQVPAPLGGFLLPFWIRVPSPRHLVVLDSGGFPNPNVPSIARVYDYNYAWDPLTPFFSASLTRTVSFAGLPVVFAEDVEVASSGLYVVAESVIGALRTNSAYFPLPDQPARPPDIRYVAAVTGTLIGRQPTLVGTDAIMAIPMDAKVAPLPLHLANN
jgi:hypothetical protein